jgi:hypothetical protein
MSEAVDRVLKSQRGLLNDLVSGLGQQMFFWGRDVLAQGNLLLEHGFERRASAGLQGTSCYRLPWCDGVLELHGACAGWYPREAARPGFLFVRADRRCYAVSGHEPVIPGRYDRRRLRAHDPGSLATAGRVFSAWLAGYERWLEAEYGAAHRRACFEMYRKLPGIRPWLPPEAACRWFAAFGAEDAGLTRARHWK